MKLSVLLIALSLFVLSTVKLNAQTPHSFKYQTIIRDIQGNPLTNENVVLRFSILQDNFSGEEVFIEIHSMLTNEMGLVNLEIGSGTVISGSIQEIDWGNHIFYLKTELDWQNSDEFVEMGISQLLAVPYALFAENVANSDDDWSFSNSHIYSANEGNVGIGTNEPMEKLHLNGSIKVEDTLKFKGFENQASGYSNPGQLLIGTNDIKVGYEKDNYGNILIGNSIYGKTIFDLELTGKGNIGIGTDVFHETTSGSSNVCLGEYTGYNLSTASNNVFIGSSAGEHISIGQTNICLGSQSGNGRNGDRNLFIGNRAGYAWNGGGSDNIILGDYAGYAYNAENSRSIFIGKNAGYDVSSDDNVFIGPLNTGKNSSGTKNIFLGYEVGKGFNGDGFLLIDNENDNEEPFIKGDMQNDKLEINADISISGKSTLQSTDIKSVLNMEELIDFPSSPAEGDLIYLNDTLRFYTGANWRNLW